MKILIADDHSVVRFGVGQIVRNVFPHAEVLTAIDFDTMLASINSFQPDLIISDINMPGCDNINLVKRIKAVSGTAKLLVFSAYAEELYAPRLLQEGADGYLHKDAELHIIHKALKDVLEKGRFVSQNMMNYFLDKSLHKKGIDQNPLKQLSSREMEVATLLSQGLGLLEISNTLNLHSSTVSTYKNRVFEKLRITNIADLLNLIRTYKSPELL